MFYFIRSYCFSLFWLCESSKPPLRHPVNSDKFSEVLVLRKDLREYFYLVLHTQWK